MNNYEAAESEENSTRPKDLKAGRSMSRVDKKREKEFRRNRQNSRGRKWQGESA
jgi:hypothetical protein